MKIEIEKTIRDIPHYPRAMKYGGDNGLIRLASNENPFPPSTNILNAILDTIYSITRYPGSEIELKELIAEKYRLTYEQVVLGNGSDEIIEMVLKAARLKGKDRVIITEPAFAYYSIAAQVYGYDMVKVPLKDMMTDLARIKEAIDERTRIIFLNNPLNPTGTIFKERDFKVFLDGIPPDVIVAVDEAYAEFAEDKDFPYSMRFIDEYPVLVLRTLSKAYALAGLRIGYCLGEASLISFLERTRQPFSINSIAIAAAKAALNDRDFLWFVLENNRKGKEFYYRALEDLSLDYVPTEANFILVKIGKDAELITRRLFEEGILVRWMGAYNLPDYIRVTIGRMDENKSFIETLTKIIKA
ncbi:MAG: histidinol-phosphate transaminase [Syntrophorhabdaceae bacterium]|nr:histidinol-phosphate transaminase [Syntrophorhabdaceae bacterium]